MLIDFIELGRNPLDSMWMPVGRVEGEVVQVFFSGFGGLCSPVFGDTVKARIPKSGLTPRGMSSWFTFPSSMATRFSHSILCVWSQ